MKWLLLFLSVAASGLCNAQSTNAQSAKQWTAEDRAYLVDNLTRSRDEVVKETTGLTEAQWNFKESPDRWSIAEVVNHIAIWELLIQREISVSLRQGAQPEYAPDAPSDSAVLGFIMEQDKHYSNEYTKPFTFAQPSTQSGPSATEWLLRMRNESINFVQSTQDDLRAFYLKKGAGNIHHRYITTFGHTDRHLRQIRKIKANAKYPK